MRMDIREKIRIEIFLQLFWIFRRMIARSNGLEMYEGDGIVCGDIFCVIKKRRRIRKNAGVIRFTAESSVCRTLYAVFSMRQPLANDRC